MSDTYSPVPELNLLKELEERIAGGNISRGFYLTDFGDRHGLDTWSEDPDFLDNLLAFANASKSGSIYVLWRIDDRTDLATLPVAALGDEGGIGVVARNLRELFQQLACDRTLYVGDYSVGFGGKDDDDAEHEQYDRHDEYLDWLSRHFGLTAPDEPYDLVRVAEKEFGAQFARWVARFWDEEDFVENFIDTITREYR